MGCSSSQTAPAWVLSMGCSPSETDCFSVGSLRAHKPCQQTCSSVGSSLPMGPQVLPEACCSMGLPQRHSLLRAHPPAPAWGFFHGLQVDICCTVNLHGLQWDSLPHHGLHHRLQGNLCSGTWSTSSLFFTDLGVCRVVALTYSHSSLQLQLRRFFSPLLQYVDTEALPLSLMGSTLASGGSVLELAGIGSVIRGGSFSWILTEAAL